MRYYETVFMVRPDLTEAQVKTLTSELSKILTDAKGKILKTENWGLRSLAYPINKSRKAHYVLIESETPAEAIIELERQARLHDDIMRSLTVRLEKPSEGPSVIMGRSGDDRDEKEAA